MMDIVEQPAKAIYLANRHPRFTRDEFRERWLVHSRVGEVLAGGGPRPISGLRYCLTVDPTGLLPGASNEELEHEFLSRCWGTELADSFLKARAERAASKPSDVAHFT